MPEVVIDFEDDATQTAVATAIKDDLAAVGSRRRCAPDRWPSTSSSR